MSAYSLLFPCSSPPPHCEAPCLQPGICFTLFSMPRNTHACKQLEWGQEASGGLQDALMALVQYLHCFEEHSNVTMLWCKGSNLGWAHRLPGQADSFLGEQRALGNAFRAAVVWLCKAAAGGDYMCICCALVACRALRTRLWQCWRMWPPQTCAVTLTSGWHLRVLLMLVRCWAELVLDGTPPNPFFKEMPSHLPLL